MKMNVKSLFLLLFLAAAALSAAAETAVPLRRFALVAGSNDGGQKLPRLKYAESDARGFASVLQELGGVRQADLVLVVSPDLQRFQDAMQRVGQLVKSPREMDERREFIVYYSGHSDDEGLILGKDRFTWEMLRHEINTIPADVKVAILDSCSSGSLTRAKGGVARPAFLFDASTDMTGHAYLTSASAEEAAQESDRIGASFFTHYLISGLRGAADTVGDGVVTLNEAYAYAFQETLASTEKTQYGPQHAAYDINLTGSGDLVLTDLRSAAAVLTVAEEVAGRLYFRDAGGKLAVELNKSAGQKVELGMQPGTYSVVLDTKGSRLGAEVKVSTSRHATLSLAAMRPLALDKATARGANPAGARSSRARPAPAPVPPPSNPAVAFGTALGAAIGSAVGSAVSAAVGAVGAVGVAPAAPRTATAAPRPRDTLEDRAALDAPSPPDASPDGLAPDEAAVAMDATGVVDPTAATAVAPDADSSTAFEAPAARAQNAYGSAARPETFHISIMPDFSMGLFSATGDHVININLLVGNAATSRAFEAGGLANIDSGNVRGFQGAGLANIVLGDVNGYQGAGLLNYTKGESIVQTAGLANISGASRGAQVAGLGNISVGPFRGAQVAGLLNLSREGGRGGQVSGMFNWAGETMTGAQVSGGFNRGHSITGPQISVVNIADTVSGAQVGVINIARHVSGTQVGVLNISEEIDGVPVGLLSFEARGRHSLDLWYDADGSTNASLSLGTNRFYTLFNAGWTPGTDPALVSFGLGIGGRSDIKPFFLDYDLSFMAEQRGVSKWNVEPASSLYPRARVVVGLPIFGSLAIEAGIAMKVLIPSLSSSIVGADASSTVFKPSFILGVHL
jgi:hypothetical protein